MDIRILGPLEVARDGQALGLGGSKERMLLAALLLHANEVVSTDSLVEQLWGGDPPPSAAKALQVYVSRLRKTLGADVIATRAPGYVVRVEPDELDLHRFERLVERSRQADPEDASAILREALALWRGAPLADFAYEAFAQAEITRLEELRFAALEQRIDADLALERHQQLVAELERLLADHPLRERLRGQLMLALYRSGRQAEALDAYQQGRRLLDDELGLEPSESLKDLQRAILAHDPSLEARPPRVSDVPTGQRSILVSARALDELGSLTTLAAALARADPARELILVHVASPDGLREATSVLHEFRGRVASEGVSVRAAAFSSPTPTDDLLRFEAVHEVDLILLDAGEDFLDLEIAELLTRAPCDVAVMVATGGAPRPGPVVVPFGAAEHDWAALELGAWFTRATGTTLQLIGAAAAASENGRDASRLLADASLIVQRTAGVPAEPLLATPGREGVLALAAGAGLLVVGLPEAWRTEGLGPIRTELAATPPAPTVFVRRGLRPGGLAPTDARTRFTWSLTAAAGR
jgi:DNA-binding SARP family transcriptional activator